jgi:CRP/FNR family transcriptional regulator, transcriptional activator FtrB
MAYVVAMSAAAYVPAIRPVGDLRSVPLLAGLSQREFGRLWAGAVTETVPAGTILFKTGEVASHLHVLRSGSVELCTDARKDCGILLLLPGESFMLEAAVFGTPYPTSARTIIASDLVRIPVGAVRALYAVSARFSEAVSQALAAQLRSALHSIIDLRTRSAPQRLGAFLLRMAEADTSTGRLPWPKRTLARRLGMSPETLSRSIQTLADNGLLLRGNRIIVRDRKRVERFCGEDIVGSRPGPGLDARVV